eukprot:206078-Amphidinium_carterae.1
MLLSCEGSCASSGAATHLHDFVCLASQVLLHGSGKNYRWLNAAVSVFLVSDTCAAVLVWPLCAHDVSSVNANQCMVLRHIQSSFCLWGLASSACNHLMSRERDFGRLLCETLA